MGAAAAMGILDELKKEAEAAEAEKARDDTVRQQELERSRAEIEPLMQSLYKYFSELKQHLTAVNKEVAAAYDIRGVGLVEGLQQGQYGVSTERIEQIDKFTFRCVCAATGVYQVNQRDAASVASYRDYLRDNGLKAKVRDTGKDSALFMVEPVVPVVIEFKADYERKAIRLRLRNLKDIGVTRHLLSLDKVNETMMDELAKAVLRTPNKFDETIGNALSNSYKTRIKEQVKEQMRQKLQEEESARRGGDGSITKRVGRTLFGRKD
jgi:hypothetical protein